MSRHSQTGSINVLLIPLIFAVLLFFVTAGFAVWAFNSRQDYKNNTDQKVAVAVKASDTQLTASLNKQFAEREKSPYKVYKGPQELGSLAITYPKTWSGYVSADGSAGNALLDGYFNPDVVPDVSSQSSKAIALRVSIVQQSYSDVIAQVTNSGNAQGITTKPFKFKNVPGVVGVELSGAIEQGKTGTMVIVPLRNNTLEVWTEGSQFTSDFNNIILPRFTFSP